MFRQILFTHLRWTRTILASMAVLTFLTPALAWWIGASRVLNAASPRAIMAGFQSVSTILIVTSLLGAVLMAAYPWTVEAATKHVLPLSLPVTWRRYVTMRFGAGALTLVLPALTLWLGALITMAMIDLPDTLRAYPGTLAIRFLTATLLAYAGTFALQYLAGRRSAVVLLVALVAMAVVSLGLEFTGNRAVVDRLVEWVTTAPGPLAVYAADWKLVDV